MMTNKICLLNMIDGKEKEIWGEKYRFYSCC